MKAKRKYTVICLKPTVYARLKRIAERDGRLLTRIAEDAANLYVEADAKRQAAIQISEEE